MDLKGLATWILEEDASFQLPPSLDSKKSKKEKKGKPFQMEQEEGDESEEEEDSVAEVSPRDPSPAPASSKKRKTMDRASSAPSRDEAQPPIPPLSASSPGVRCREVTLYVAYEADVENFRLAHPAVETARFEKVSSGCWLDDWN